MSESIWWPDVPWYERKTVPLGFITLSFRQLITIAVSFVAAYAASLPFQFPMAGFGFGGRASVFCLIFGVGYVISSRSVRMLPAELQALYLVRTRGIDRLGGHIRTRLPSRKSQGTIEAKSVALKMLVEDFRNPVPLLVTDRAKEIAVDTKVVLLLDDQSRAEAPISPRNPRYRLAYTPLPQDIGEHTLTVRLADTSEPLTSVSLSLVGRSQDAKSPSSRKE